MKEVNEQLTRLAASSKKIESTPENFEHVILSQEEITEALRIARECKHHELHRRQYLEDLKKTPTYYKYTAKELLEGISQTICQSGEPYVIDEENEVQIKKLCLYFAGDKRFETQYGLKLDKGLLLMGLLGNGKSHAMRFFQNNQMNSYNVVKARAIVKFWQNEVQEQAVKAVDYYSTNREMEVNRFGHKIAGLCIDDLGTEAVPAIRFGDRRNVIEEIILSRYDDQLPFNTTHITTNITEDEIESKYGSRVRDRLREMCNVIVFEGQSRRK